MSHSHPDQCTNWHDRCWCDEANARMVCAECFVAIDQFDDHIGDGVYACIACTWTGRPDCLPCQCWQCITMRGEPINFMILCAKCGNKRCPHANDHLNECTGSNEVGQAGSAYEHGSGAASARRLLS